MRVTLEQARLIVDGNHPRTGHWVSYDPETMKAHDLIPLVYNGLKSKEVEMEMMAEQFKAAVDGLNNELAILALIAGFVTVHIPEKAYEDIIDDGWDGEVSEHYVKIGEETMTHPDHIKFVTACRRSGMKPYVYHGRFYYSGPGVNVSSIAEAARLGVNVPMLYDDMGRGFVIYTRVSESGDPERDQACAVAMEHFQELIKNLNPLAYGARA